MAYDDEDDNDYDKPVEEGKTYTVEIDDLGSKGDGIARVEGFVVFVPETEVGETVRVEVNSVGRKFAFAEVVDRDVEADEVEDEDERYDKDEVDEEGELDDVEEEPEAVEEPEEDVDDESDEDDERYDKEETDEEDVDEGYEKDEVDEDEELLDAPATEEELDEDLGVDDEQRRKPEEL